MLKNGLVANDDSDESNATGRGQAVGRENERMNVDRHGDEHSECYAKANGPHLKQCQCRVYGAMISVGGIAFGKNWCTS